MEAVEKLTGVSPDLIVLDLMMPRLDGFGLLAHIRGKLTAKPLRVLVATAKVLEESDQEKLSSWPVVGVLNKGELDIAQMVTLVGNALKQDPVAPPADTSAEKPAEKPAATPVVTPTEKSAEAEASTAKPVEKPAEK